MGMRTTSRRWLFVIMLVLALVDALFIVTLLRPSFLGNVNGMLNAIYRFELLWHGISIPTPVKSQPLALPVVAYVVGPPQFIGELVDLGVPVSMIRPANLSELSMLPSGSIVVVDWDYVNGTMHELLNQLSNQLQALIGRKDLVILYTKKP
ncbi:MAG: hypothetical protein ACP5NQ_09665 [Vulcanisaeta sp.]